MSDRVINLSARPKTPANERRRRAPRQRAFLEGRVLYFDRARTLNVTIRNLGADGAMIEGEGLHQLPERFDLAFVARGYTRPARVAWSAFDKAGVALGEG